MFTKLEHILMIRIAVVWLFKGVLNKFKLVDLPGICQNL